VSPRQRGAFVLVLAGLALAWAFAFPAWPDDWDGLGFLASIHRFDLASFAPHPPGYPVYVACLKAAAWVASSPIAAARLVALASGVVTFGAVCLALPVDDTGASPFERALAAAAVCATPLAFHAFSGVGSEAPALAFAALALLGVAAREGDVSPRARTLLVGLGVGLGLGVRLSWAPFYVAFLLLLPASLRLRGVLVSFLATLAWAIPLVLLTGPSHLVALYRTQAGGHFERWGGTSLTDPERARFLARDLLADGFGAGRDLLGLAILAAFICAIVVALLAWRSRPPSRSLAALAFSSLRRRGEAGRGALLVAPYLAWVTLGQNLREQPRHVLPLVFLLAYALARAALMSRRALRPLFLALALLVLTRTSLDAVARKAIPPPGAQLLAYVRAHASLRTTAVFAGASGRFLDGTEWQPHVHPVGSLPDALLAVTHLDTIPDTILLTSELTALDESPAPLADVAAFCRPSRIDRRTTCLHLYALDGKAAFAR
jgi:hypothetical protein